MLCHVYKTVSSISRFNISLSLAPESLLVRFNMSDVCRRLQKLFVRAQMRSNTHTPVSSSEQIELYFTSCLSSSFLITRQDFQKLLSCKQVFNQQCKGHGSAVISQLPYWFTYHAKSWNWLTATVLCYRATPCSSWAIIKSWQPTAQ